MKVTKWDGQPITKPGWYSGIPIERYHSAGICDAPAVSSSNLRRCWSHSEAHMFSQWCENPNAEPKEMTRPMILGSATHHLILGEDKFSTKFVGQPTEYPDSKTGELKPWHNGSNYCKDWNARNESRVIVTQKELAAIVSMARSLELEPLVKDDLLRGHVECSGFFKHRESNLWVKVRPDVIPTDSGDFADLKTATEVTTVALQSAIRTYGLHMQAALIWEACETLGQDFATFTLMFIETGAPFCARAVPVDDRDLSLGRRQNRLMLRKIRKAIDLNHFPGPGEGELKPLPLGDDERKRIETRLKLEGDPGDE